MGSFAAIKDTILSFLAAGVSIWVVSELHSLRKSIEQLNLQFAEYVANSKFTDKRVERLEKRVFEND